MCNLSHLPSHRCDIRVSVVRARSLGARTQSTSAATVRQFPWRLSELESMQSSDLKCQIRNKDIIDNLE